MNIACKLTVATKPYMFSQLCKALGKGSMAHKLIFQRSCLKIYNLTLVGVQILHLKRSTGLTNFVAF